MIKINVTLLIDFLVASGSFIAILLSIFKHETDDLPYLVIILFWSFRLLMYDYEFDEKD